SEPIPAVKNMNSPLFRNWSLGLALLVLPLANGCVQQASSSPESAAALINPDPNSESPAQAGAEEEADWADTTADISDAPAKALSRENPLPPNIMPTGPLADFIKLAESGVDETVMRAYVANSTSTFSLDSDEIIYLNDLGVPATVITAMIAHDENLKSF